MADILIKGMEIPDCCYGCPLVYDMGEGNYACPFFNGYAPIDGRRDDCPLIELPPHGRLVDGDKLLADHNPNENWDYMVLECIIRNAPTVVEATT